MTESQSLALTALQAFLTHPTQSVFILNGPAGTGKTTLVKQLCDHLKAEKTPFLLTATTGRAAKVLSAKSGHDATTVHSALYLFQEISGQTTHPDEDPWASETGQLFLQFGLRQRQEDEPHPEVIIVDEASMLSNSSEPSGHTARFGSGNLLADLLHFAGTARLIFVGDACQLPPVAAEAFSPALSVDFWQSQGREGYLHTLTEIVRQQQGNEVLEIAGFFRRHIEQPSGDLLRPMPPPQGRNVFSTSGRDGFLEAYYQLVQSHGVAQAVAICHSNAEAHILNRIMRQRIHGQQEPQPGDVLMVVQNSYSTGLVNGDQVVIETIAPYATQAGFTFIRLTVKSIFSHQIFETLAIRELLYTENAGLQPAEVKKLLIDFDQRMRNAGIKRKSAAYNEKMMNDPFLNALRAKYGYAITVHKAQGGEWDAVFLYLNKSIFGMAYVPGQRGVRHPDAANKYHRWFYTAVTRAREKLVVNDSPLVAGFATRDPKGYKGYWRDIQTGQAVKALEEAAVAGGTLEGTVLNLLPPAEFFRAGFLKVKGHKANVYFRLTQKHPAYHTIAAGRKVSFVLLPAREGKGPKASQIKVLP